MITVGVTGGIGSGKTTFCRELEKLGARVIYADDLAKELMVKDPEVIRMLTQTFGSDTYTDDGTLNKPHLIREAFQKARVEELNDIVHPAVHKEFNKIARSLQKSDQKMLVKEAALLLNKGRPDYLDVVVIVLSDQELRVERVQKRDRVSTADILSRIEKQPDFEKIAPLADYTIYNDGNLKELRNKAQNLFKKLTQ